MAKQQAHYGDRIVQDPAIMVGKPVVRGTRVPVELVLAKLAHNLDLTQILADYPRLTIDDVKACLQYAKVLVGKVKKAKPRPPTAGAPDTR